ncbi:MAG: SUMF1/EgtB/PvdO family nonheme iron enzyme [Deltaproteobacteria bacterium]|nr:SUMF1/EgtB/PvdO family nonheme iron enzyme [Deltaproteobacteria bacterium]
MAGLVAAATLTLVSRPAAAACDCKGQGLSSDASSYQWEAGGPCIHDPCKELGDYLRSNLPRIGTARFVGCAPTNQPTCPIYVGGLGAERGITTKGYGARGWVPGTQYPGCHYATEDNTETSSFSDAKGQLSDPYTKMSGTAAQRQALAKAMGDFGSPVLCHSWGTGTCAANIGSAGNVSYAGGLCPVGARCVVNTGDSIPRLIYNQLLEDGVKSRFVRPPDYPYGQLEPHAAANYFDPNLGNPGEYGSSGGAGWSRNASTNPRPAPPPSPKCDNNPNKPQVPNGVIAPVWDPPYAGAAGEEDGSSSCTASGARRASGGHGPLGLVGLLGVLIRRRDRRRRALVLHRGALGLPLLVLLAFGLSCGSSPGAPEDLVATKRQALVGQVGCSATACVDACVGAGRATLGASCSEYCQAMVARCCVPFDGTGASVDSMCAMEEWLLRAGLKNADGTNASCGLDRDCDGRDDCSGLASSLCCGDADCDGRDDCTDAATTDTRCPAPCGDANCDGIDDCRPKLSSSSCNAAFAGQVAAICSATSSRIAGRISAGDLDVYALTAAAGDSIHVDINAVDVLQSTLNPVVRLTDASGTTVASASHALGADQALDVTAGATGTYYVWVAGSPDTSFSGAGTSVGEYTLGVAVAGTSVTASPRGCADAGSDPATAQALVAAASVPAASSQSSCTASCGVPALSAAATMVRIPGGWFRSGCNAFDIAACYGDEPARDIHVNEFLLDRTEITQSAYKRCIDAGKCTAPATTTSNFDPIAMPEHPVVDVTWFQAAQYCKWTGKRLPTEAEWEKAARGADGRKYPWGSLPPDCTLSNANNCNSKFQAVGSHPTGISPYGVLDMAGNVAEWVQDWYDADYWFDAPSRNPMGPTEAERFPWDNARYWKVTRGGSFSVGSDTLDNNTFDHLRASRRAQNAPDAHSPRLGFRCAAGGAECRPRSCADSGQCGLIPDGCGGTIDCGGCAAPATCGGGGTPNLCGCAGGSCTTWSRRFGFAAGTRATTAPGAFDLVTALDGSDNVFMLSTVSSVAVNLGGVDLAPLGTGSNVVLAKYDAHGGHLWSIRLGATGSTSGHALTVDAAGDVFAVGNFTGTTNLGGVNLTSAGANDVFVAKYSGATGTHVWSRQYGSTGDELGYGVAADAAGGVYVTGYFTGTGSFGGPDLVSAGGSDVFVARIASPDGAAIWSSRFGSAGADYGIQVSVDSTGNAVVGGHFSGTVSFGGSSLVSAGGTDVFVAKLSSTATHLWSVRGGGAGNDALTNLAVSAADDIAITGTYYATPDFGGGALPKSLGPFYMDLYVVKYSGAGAHVWSRGLGTDGQDSGRAVAFDGAGNVVLLGNYAFGALGEPIDAGGGALPYRGFDDILLAEYDGVTGAHVWSKSIGGDDSEQAWRSLAIASTGEIVFAGRFISTVDLGSGWLTGPRTNYQLLLARVTAEGPCRPRSCAEVGAECGAISDGCGGTLACGTCQEPATCGTGGPNKCGCSATTCASAAATCGQKLDGCGGVLSCFGGLATDNACAANKSCFQTATSCAAAGASCGQIQNGCDQVYSCGTCSAGLTCGGGGVANACGSGACTPKTCAQLGKNCGKVSDGCGGVVDCGACATGTCGGAGTANVCGICVPKTCAELGKNCGTVSDGCGGFVDCGTCSGTQVCGGGGDAVCGCVAQTCAANLAACGTIGDGCGGTLDCGSCSSGAVCGADLASLNQCCAPTSCAAQGKTCGSISDGCGHALDCGTCSGNLTCGGGGTANTCGCTPRTCAQIGANCGSIADGCGGTLDCGTCIAPRVCGPNNTCELPWPKIIAGAAEYGDGTYVGGVAVDATGDVVVAGRYYAPITFSNSTTVASGKGLFIGKYSASGTLLWLKTFDTTGSSSSLDGLALDGAGDIVVTGQLFGSCDFGGGVTTGDSGNGDVFVAKFAGADGSYRWARHSAPTAGVEAVAADGAGNVVIVGHFYGSAALGGTTLTSAGGLDIYVARYGASDGAHLWSKRFGGSGDEWAVGLATDASGNVFVSGSVGSTINFGTTSTTNLASAGGYDIFVASLSSSGEHRWSKRFGSTGSDVGYGVAVSTAGVLALTGAFEGSVDFGGGTLTSAGSNDVFLSSLDAATGNFRWAKRFGDASKNLSGDGIGEVSRVTFSGTDNVVLAGASLGSGIDFGGGVLPHYPCGTYCGAYFAASFGAADGAHRSSVGGYDPQHVSVSGLATDGAGNVFLGGKTSNWSSSNGTLYGVVLPKPVSGTIGMGYALKLGATGCAPTTCAVQGATCGTILDGCGGSLNCGACTAPSVCGKLSNGSASGRCCLPTTCASLGKNCGSIPDGCGGTLSCGTCDGAWPQTCGGGGAGPNVCGCPAGTDGCAQPEYWSRALGAIGAYGLGDGGSVDVATDGTILRAFESNGNLRSIDAHTSAGSGLWTRYVSGGGGQVAADDSNHAVFSGQFADGSFLEYDSVVFGKQWSRSATPAGAISNNVQAVVRGPRVAATFALSGTVDLGGGPLAPITTRDVGVAMYGDDGTLVWAKRFSGAPVVDYSTYISSIAQDASGNVYIAGRFYDAVSFGGTAITPNKCFVGGYWHYGDFLVKLAVADGQQVWAKALPCEKWTFKLRGSDSGGVLGLFVDSGFTIVQMLDGVTGNAVWTKAYSSSSGVSLSSAAFDSAGDVVVVGSLSAPFDFGGGAVGRSGTAGLFAVKYTAGSGAHVWSRAFGGGYVADVAVDRRPGASALVLHGWSQSSSVDFDVYGGPIPASRYFLARLPDPPSCTPDCAGRTCGSDGCGGTCGACTGTGTCGGTCTSAGTCSYPASTVGCSDGNACTSGDHCDGAGRCVVATSITTCSQSSDACCPGGCTASSDTDCGYCGDAICSCSEASSGSCPGDCRKTGKSGFSCGNARCETGETATSCPADCGGGCP